jgi:hypothetical protein
MKQRDVIEKLQNFDATGEKQNSERDFPIRNVQKYSEKTVNQYDNQNVADKRANERIFNKQRDKDFDGKENCR